MLFFDINNAFVFKMPQKALAHMGVLRWWLVRGVHVATSQVGGLVRGVTKLPAEVGG